MKCLLRAIASIALVVTTAGIAVGQQSPDWVLVGQSDGGDRYFVDENSVSRTGDWVQYSYLTMYGQADNGTVAALLQFTANCTSEQYRVDRVDAIAASGEVILSETPDPQMRQFAEGSSGQGVLQSVCE